MSYHKGNSSKVVMIILSSHLCGLKVVLEIIMIVSSVVTPSHAPHMNCESESDIDQNLCL